MASPGTKVMQIVKPHVRLIKFPHQRILSDGQGNVTNAFQPPPVQGQLSNVASTPSSSSAKPIGNTPRGSAISDTSLPERYRRKPIDDVEIEYIMRGGPE